MTQTLSESTLRTFAYEKPAMQGRPKASVNLARGGVLGLGVQVVKADGGETNLHAHAATESVWLVLKGRARFYDTEDHLFGEYGPLEGIGIPRAAPYWFEGAPGDEDLEIAHITVTNKNAQNHRLNFSPLRARQVERHQKTELRDLSKHNAKPMQSVKYGNPSLDGEMINVTQLYDEGDMLQVSVEKIAKGAGDLGLHAHTGSEGAWLVLGGVVRFVGADGESFDLSANEGVFIPVAEGYGFESVGDEPLEILHIKARDVRIEKSERVDIEPRSRGAADGGS